MMTCNTCVPGTRALRLTACSRGVVCGGRCWGVAVFFVFFFVCFLFVLFLDFCIFADESTLCCSLFKKKNVTPKKRCCLLTRTHTHRAWHVYAHTHTRTHMHTHARTQTLTHTHTHTHTHTDLNMQHCSLALGYLSTSSNRRSTWV